MTGPRRQGAPRTRRSFLRSAALGGTAGLAGCAGNLPNLGGIGNWEPRAAGDADGRNGASDATDRAPADENAFVTFRGGLQRRGYHPEATIPQAVRTAWRIPGINVGDHTAAKASAVRDPDGNYVVPGDTGDVDSFTVDGEVNWATTTFPSGRGIHGTPTIANDLVYVGAYDGALYAFDVRSGEQVWRTQLGDAIGSSPAYHGGVVYIAVEHYDPSGSVAGVDALTGEVVWTDDRPTDHPHSSIAIDRDAGRLVVGSNDGNLYAWSYPDLEPLWKFETGRPIKGPIATHDGGAFFGSWDENVYRVGLESGEKQWAFETDGYVMSGAAVDPEANVVYIGGHDYYLRAFDAGSGEQRWRYRTDGSIIGCPVVTKDHVLVGSYDDHLHAVTREGEKVWAVEADGWVSCEPLVDEDGIVFTSRATQETSGKAVRLVGMV